MVEKKTSKKTNEKAQKTSENSGASSHPPKVTEKKALQKYKLTKGKLSTGKAEADEAFPMFPANHHVVTKQQRHAHPT